jgi:hypothetical protein
MPTLQSIRFFCVSGKFYTTQFPGPNLTAFFHGGTSCLLMGKTGQEKRAMSVSGSISVGTVINSRGSPLWSARFFTKS